jgi:hypothetical protein
MQHAFYTVSLGIFRLFPRDAQVGNAATESATSNSSTEAEEIRFRNQKWTRKASLSRLGNAPVLKGMEVL